jgi:imidazolonepropionase-like amidohydrolase
MNQVATVVLAALVWAVPLAAQTTPPPAKIALTGGRIITVSGAEIPSGTVLIERGRIVAVGADVQIPYDAVEVEVDGKVLMPGMIDPHSWRGLDVPNEPLAVAPFLDVADALDPSRIFFEDSLRDGVTSVHVIQADNCVIGALSRVVRPVGLSVGELTVATDIALKMATSPRSGYDRMRQMAELRAAFASLDHYLDRLAEKKYEDSLKDKDETLSVGPAEARKRGRELLTDEDYDDQNLNLIRLRRGDIGAWIAASAATDVGPAITLASEQGFLDNTVLVLGPQAHKAVGEIRRAGVPVVLDPALYHRERDRATGRIRETFIPRVFYDAGVPFALQPNPSDSMAERYLNYQAALLVRHGIPRDEAIKAVTLTPAKLLGLEEHLGSIEPGKVANIVVFSGDPLDFSSWVQMVYVDGVLAYERERDPRMRELLGMDDRRSDGATERRSDEGGGEAQNPGGGEGGDASGGRP